MVFKHKIQTIGLPRVGLKGEHSVEISGQNLKIEKLRMERSGQHYTNIGVYIRVGDFLVWLLIFSFI